VGDGEPPGGPPKVKVQVNAEDVHVSVSGRAFVFDGPPPFSVRAEPARQ